MRHIKIGSRASLLAKRQAEIIMQKLREHYPEDQFEIVTFSTAGDRYQGALQSQGGKGLFVKELDRALYEGRIDLAVHSLKDMPLEQPPALPILAYSQREDPRDALILKQGITEENLIYDGGLIGTASPRRMLQLKQLYPRCSFALIRGNVQTRLQRLEKENFSATILAAAGLIRLEQTQVMYRLFSTEEMITAAGQGILAVQGREGEWDLQFLNDRKAQIAAQAERSFVRAAGGSCSSPIAAYAWHEGETLWLRALYAELGGQGMVKGELQGKPDEAEAMGIQLARALKG